ncbi:MraY family glycosyltransferase [Gulosibacter sp. 10]|uniref:MraY family glycosyltransferase n=1 Tax=Gulosibacter sp. 10 TaxID=1255570 RepID=UPI00097F3D0F|nr:MraY family glycosyltransferase [Gulosibacter sp. 10]SJM57695.1 Undecaprenyl-phosphate N-acetylglucosaminyl 1-phosphate transferase [Gulosibacter sp. 10]
MRFYGLIIALAAVVSFVLCVAIYKLAMRYRWYPAVRERDVHRTPKPRLGGLAMYFAFLAALAIASQIGWFGIVFAAPGRIFGLIGAVTLIVVVGVIDDFVDLDWMIKLAAQIVAGLILAFNGVAITSLPIGGLTVTSQWMSIAITVLLVVLVMNAVNFIDGLDGLVAGVAIIANGVFLVYSFFLSDAMETSRFSLAALISAIVVGICLGFLPLNWNPSRMFMGDGGALQVGLLMAASTIAVTGEVDPSLISRDALFPAFLPLILPFAVLIVPLMDFTLAVVRRLGAGKSPFSADRKHLHHRLLDMGHTQRRAVLLFYAWAIVIGGGALLMFLVRPVWVAPLVMGSGLVLCTVLTVAPLSQRKRLETRAQRSPYGDDDDEFDPLDRLGREESDRVRANTPAPVALKKRIRRLARRDSTKPDPSRSQPRPEDEE